MRDNGIEDDDTGEDKTAQEAMTQTEAKAHNTSISDAHSNSGTDGVETDDGDLQTLTDDSVRLDGVGVSSAEDSSDEGTVNKLSLG
jgi:hypothetical protein